MWWCAASLFEGCNHYFGKTGPAGHGLKNHSVSAGRTGPRGIGSALSEEVRYDEHGRPPAGTLMTRPACPLTGSPSAL